MWRIGLLLLLFSRIDSLQCPEGCDCVQTGQRRSNGSEIQATYQITCRGIRNLPSVLQKLPDPTTQLIIHEAVVGPVQATQGLQAILALATHTLPHLTDFSFTSCVAASQGDQLIKEFLPFASITNPVLLSPGFPRLQILNLSNNTLKYLPVGLFRSCSALQTLDLSDNLITNFETDTFHPLINLLRLDLRRNRLQALSEAIFRNLTKLLTLDVSGNKISRISPTTFQYLTSLNTLILAGNPLASSSLVLGAGRHLQVVDASATGLRQAPTSLERTVRTLILKDNQLSAVRCGDLDSYSLLSTLYLDGNHISYVEEDAMGRMELLNELHLSHNKLFHVPRSLPENLFLIDLSFNLIQNMSNSDFLNLSLLKELSLNNNQIRHIEDNTFVNLVNLRVLDLSRNPILYLPPFTGLTQLQVLNLSYLTNVSRAWRLGLRTFPVPSPGNIEELRLEASPSLSSLFLSDTATLEQFLNLTVLELRFSNLTTLRKDIFILLPSLQKLNLEGNPWCCDREMLVTAEWVRAHVVRGETATAMHCATPPELHGIPLSHLTPAHFPDEPIQNSLGAAHPATRKPVASPSNNEIDWDNANAIGTVDNGERGIEKTSNALRGFTERKTTLPAAAVRGNEVHDADVSNTSVTASTDGFNRSHTPIDSPVSPTSTEPPPPPTTLSPRVASSTSRLINVPVPDASATTSSNQTTVSAKSLSKSWMSANASRDSETRVASHISGRLASEAMETVPSDGSARNDTKAGSWTAERRGVSARGETEDPGDVESTTPADLGVKNSWEDPSAVLADNRTLMEVNNTGADALSAQQPTASTMAAHPGLIVMGAVSLVMAAAFTLMVLHVRRRTRHEGYVLQDHEMEIHSISNFAASELW